MMRIYSGLNAGQIAFLIIVPIVVLVGVFLLIFLPLRKRKMKKDFKYFYYRNIYKVALENDYYLINDFRFKIDDTHVGVIDHILFANKYIYIITDHYYEGDLDGKETDASFIFINRTGKKFYSENLVASSKKLMNKLSIVTGIGASLMIGVNIINNGCTCGVKSESKNCYIIQSKKFKSLIKAIESRPIGDINQEQLALAVQAVDRINKRKKKNAKK